MENYNYEIVDTIGLECYTPKDVMRILKISKPQTYNLFNSKVQGEEFPSFRCGKNWRVTITDFNNWLNQKRKTK